MSGHGRPRKARLSMDATTLRSSFEQRWRWPEGLPRRGYNRAGSSARKTQEVYPQGNISRKPLVQEGRLALLLG